MSVVILRRPKLGRTSAKEIKNLMRTRDVSVVRHDRDPLPNNPNVLIRWGCTANARADVTFNSAEAIRQVNDKLEFRRTLQDANLCPATWFFTNNNKLVFGHMDRWPVIVRPAHHAQGRNLVVCNNNNEVQAAIRKFGTGYISVFINKVAEYRVAVVQGRAVWVAKKTPGNPQDVAWNVARGGRFDNVRFDDWPLKAVKKSIEAFNLSTLDFGGVDVMVDAEGNCYILEINSAPSLTSPYRQECMAKAFDYMIANGKERIPLVNEKGNYLKFIHPSISDRAKV